MNSFSKKEMLERGFDAFKRNWQLLVGVLIIIFLVDAVPDLIVNALEKDQIMLILTISIFGWLLSVMLKIGVINILLKLVYSKKAVLEDLIAKVNLFFNYLIGYLLYALIVFVGLLLLIVPGIIWAIQFSFFNYLIVGKNMKPIEALKESATLTRGHKGNLALLILLIIGINIIGALLLLVGLLVTIPTTMLAYTYAYRKISASKGKKKRRIKKR